MKFSNFEDSCISPNNLIHHAMKCIDQSGKGIALVIDEKRQLLGIITDGDIRRAILAGQNLEMPVSEILTLKKNSPFAHPVTASEDTDRTVLLKMFQDHGIRQIPLIDKDGRVSGLVTLDELLPDQLLPLNAVIMAGGFGTRMRPLTEDLPKPMLPIGGRPLMEHIVEQLQRSGVRRVNVTTHYKPEKIMEHFGDGQDFGVELNYVNEDHPLGTAGALALIDPPKEPLLVINGDILTKVDFRSMLNFHQTNNACLTVAVRKYDFNVPYGVIESDGVLVQKLTEKPLFSFFVNAGIYLLEPKALAYIPNKSRFDMTDLIQTLLDENLSVANFPILEYWLDIGQHNDYQQAQQDVNEGRLDT